MQLAFTFSLVLLLPFVVCQESAVIGKTDPEIYNNKLLFFEEKPLVNYKDVLPSGLLIDIQNFSQSEIVRSGKKKPRKVRVRKRKDKNGKYSKSKINPQKSPDDLAKHILRNQEKANLVRNKTIEILKSGLKILSAAENLTEEGNKTSSRVNETLLEKILSSAASKQDVLLSASGTYKLPVGFKIYETKKTAPSSQTLIPLADDKQQIKRQSKKQSKSSSDDYDYEYDLLSDFNINTTKASTKLSENVDYEALNTDKTVGNLLEKIVKALKNLTNCSHDTCSYENRTPSEDPCQKWLNCRESLHQVFIGDGHSLPSCPCTYPSSIFYDEMIWDKNQKKYFRWRDASSEVERLDIYKPGASYCIRSLLTQGSLSVSSQQCCYDRSLRLLTRGSGAGTVNFISPDVSRKLHFTADILPWRLCKGDFTRYNIARNPDNGNNCPENPDEQQYQLQVKVSKFF